MITLLASFGWTHAVALLGVLATVAVALFPYRLRRPSSDGASSAARLANIETRLGCVEKSLDEHRAETRAGMSQILDHLLSR